MRHALHFCFTALLTCFGVLVSVAHSETHLQMQVGEVRVLALPDIARVAVGDGHVLNAVTTTEKEVIVFARNEGSSALQLWSENGERLRYLIDVAPVGARQTQQELQSVLERIPGASVSSVGEKLLVEGDALSDADRERIVELSKRYPQLLDFTGVVGWDRMVLLDVQVLEIPRSYLRELGVRWNGVSQGGATAGISWDHASSSVLDRPGETVMPVNFPERSLSGYFGLNALLSAHIDALVQTGEAVVLAQPQLLARSGSVAEFLAGGEVPYSTVDANGNVNTEFKPYGVSLNITPQIERNGGVRSRVEVEVSSVDTTYTVANGPALKTRRAATDFNAQSGQTLVLAGFISREDARNIDGLPGLSNVPILGELFRSRRFQRNETELAIFVTPVLVSADHPDMQKRVQKGRAVMDATFGTKTNLNTPVNDLQTSQYTPRHDSASWDPWSGQGSQWQQSTPELRHTKD